MPASPVARGRTRVNDFSIGIELEGSDDQPFEPVQYQTLAELTHAIRRVYPDITPDRIYGHADIAPGRKTDPVRTSTGSAIARRAPATRGDAGRQDDVRLLATAVCASVQYPHQKNINVP